MSSLNITYYGKTKKQLENIKRKFRESFNEDIKSIGHNNMEIDFDNCEIDYHVTTQANNNWENDEVDIWTTLLEPDRFVLQLRTYNEYFEKDNKITFFIDNDIREELIKSLQDIVVHRVEEK